MNKRDQKTIPAKDANEGGLYLSKMGRRITIKRKTSKGIEVVSMTTGNIVMVQLDYPLVPVWETLF